MNQLTEPSPNYAPVKRAKSGIDYNAPFAAEMIKQAVFYLRPMSPRAYCLSVLASSFWDSTTANGVIHPEMERTCVSLGITMDELLDIAQEMAYTLSLEELESGAKSDWAIHYDTTDADNVRILSYQPLFLEWVAANREALKKRRISINHTKTMTRYTLGLEIGLAKAMSILATALTPSVFNDFGFAVAEKVQRGSAPYQIWHTDRNGKTKGTKLQHNAQFSHPLLLDRSPAGAAELFQIKELTPEMVEQSYCARISLGVINEKFLLGGDYQAILDAISEINDFGWHTVRVLERGADMSQWEAIFTPTLAFHNFVWKMDFFAAGPMLTRWEVENGFIPFGDDTEQGDDPVRYMPALGYHYLYGLRSARTGEFITVGQTTQSLTTRLHQHERAGSNGEANEGILEILSDPNDHIEIIHFATVHHAICSAKEMSLASQMLRLGHNIKNKILTVKDNDRTVKLDARFGSADFIKRNWWAVQEKLDLVKNNHEGKEILFMIESLPEVPAPPVNEAVRWLFETVEFSAADETSNPAESTDEYTQQLWAAADEAMAA